MNFEFAKRLELAGFPKGKEGLMLTKVYVSDSNLPVPPENTAYEPSLSEIIRACKTLFHSMHYVHSRSWITHGTYDPAHLATPFDGVTDKESVGLLWLELRKKNLV